MAINEACQVWIEQRIKEELDDGSDRSIREIGRVIATEIEKIFEAKVSPMTIYGKVRRRKMEADTNVSGLQNPDEPRVKTGQGGQKINPKNIVEEVDSRVKKGKSIRAAAQEVAEICGKKASTVREAYRKEKEKAHYQCTATQAVSFAQMAIFQLERITKDDEQWEEALLMVENWITNFRSTK